jgi:hypothetical protein
VLLFTEDWGEVEECLCHGDLNAGNILVNSQHNRAAFIDFQNTGFHNIFRDFVSFESSIRIDYNDGDTRLSPNIALKNEIQLSNGNEGVWSGYLAEISKVRGVAFANFPVSEGSNRKSLYLIASYIHFSWLVTRFSTDWSPEAKRRLCLGAFASLCGLETLTET